MVAEQVFRHEAAHREGRVDEVADALPATLRDQLVCVAAIEFGDFRPPVNHAGRRDTHGVIQWPGAADDPDLRVVLESGPVEPRRRLDGPFARWPRS